LQPQSDLVESECDEEARAYLGSFARYDENRERRENKAKR
jgi:hypothetical protein